MKFRVIALFVTLLPVVMATASAPKVESFAINDTTYGLERRVWLFKALGTAGAATHSYKLFVFLQKEYIDELAIPATLQRLVASGEIPPTIAVVLDTSTERPTDIANRAKFDRFVTADLLPWLRTKFGRLPDPKNVAIAGFSVGGLAAAYVAYRHPDVFGNVLTQSGAFWRGNEGANDPAEWLTNELRNKPRLALRFYIEVGSGETHRSPNGVIFVEANRHLRDVLAMKGYVFRYTEVPRNIHDPKHLRPTVAAGIVYLSKAAE